MMIWVLLIVFSCFIMALRAFLIVIGAYKDPVFASFENYGEERIFSPFFSLIIWGGAFLYFLLFLYFNAGLVVALGLFLMLVWSIFKGRFENLLSEHHIFFRIFPHWYFELASRTSREERRRIAYLWLRLPGRTRLLYNARNRYFDLWIDLVLLSIIR